jgi:hypothetical protein
MNLEQIEEGLGLKLPERHRRAMLDPGDRVHAACDFLLPWRTDKMRDILQENESLHGKDNCDPWPSYLVAFASNGCGDFFAYDLRSEPHPVIYIDPDCTVEENLGSDDRLTFASFEDWYDHKVA